MFSVPDITVEQYLQLDEMLALRYDIYIENIKPRATFCGKSLDTSRLTYEQVELIKMTFRNPTVDEIKDLFVMLWGIKGNMQMSSDYIFFNTSVFDLFRAKNYIQKYITGLIEKERNMLIGIPDEKSQMVNAGERLAPVSYILTKNKLAERFSCMPKDIANMKYREVFLILLADKMYSDVSHDYNEIK